MMKATFTPTQIEAICLPATNGDHARPVKGTHGLWIDSRNGRLFDGEFEALQGQLRHVQLLAESALSPTNGTVVSKPSPIGHLRWLAERLYKLGVNITLIGQGGKRPMHKWKHWQFERQSSTDFARLPWQGYTNKDGWFVEPVAVGVVNGSGGLRAFDLDGLKGGNVPVPETAVDLVLRVLGLQPDYAWVVRSGSGLGWQIYFRCDDELPEGVFVATDKDEPGVFWGVPHDATGALDHIELRWSSGQTVIAGEHPEGPGYSLRHGEPETEPAWVTVTAVVQAFYTLAKPRANHDKEQRNEGADGRLPTIIDDINQAIRDRFDLVTWAETNISRDIQQESNGEWRILGHGGLLINPEKRIWNCFGDGEEGKRWCGDCFDLVGWQRYGDAWFSGKRNYWREVQQIAADFAGVSLTPAATTKVEPSTAVSQSEQVMGLRPLRMADLMAQHFDPLEFLVDGVFAKGHLVLLGGRAKSGKSWLDLQLAKCIDMQQPFLGRDTRFGKVLYIVLEDGERRVRERSHILKWQPQQADVIFHIAKFDGQNGTLGPGLTQIAEAANRYDLIIIDTLIATLSSGANENDNAQMGAIINELARIAHTSNTAIVLVHHTGKSASEDVFNTLRGASALRGGYDVGLLLERKPGEAEAVLHTESRDVEVENMTLRQLANGGWEYVGNSHEIEKIRAGRETIKAMLEHDPDGEGKTAKEIAKHRSVSESAVYRQLNRLVEDGYIEKIERPSTGEGKEADLFLVKEMYR